MLKLRPGYVTLERALSKLGVSSRTQAHEWILAGRVRVNGTLRKDPAFAVSPERAVIEIDGQRIERAPPRTFALHKPRGTVTTRVDEKNRPTVFSLLEGGAADAPLPAHLIAVGRLDWATSGLLLLTNDTRLSDWLTDPAHGISRVYVVTVRGEVTEDELARMRHGVEDDGKLLQADEIELRKASGRESHLTVRLHEGKNREIRRIFSTFRHEVTRLKRIRYGGLELGELPPGKYRELDLEELARAFPGAPIRSMVK